MKRSLAIAVFMSACASSMEWPAATNWGEPSSRAATSLVQNRFANAEPIAVSDPEIAQASKLALDAKATVENNFGFRNSNTRIEEVRRIGRSIALVKIGFVQAGDGYEQIHVLERDLLDWKHVRFYRYQTWSVRQ